MQLTNIIRTISLIGAFALAVTTARAVSPPPDGGYPNQTTAEGDSALFSLTTGTFNTATGFQALFSLTTGSFNTASGAGALQSTTTADYNTANGWNALQSNTTGTHNTANGVGTLVSNITGNFNTANGASALQSNTGNNNTADGVNTLLLNTTGHDNIALGFEAGTNLTTGNFNIDIGNQGVAAEANTIRIGTTGTQTATFVAAIRGVPIAGGAPVAVSASGQLGMRSSSARFKEAIKPMDKASEAIFSLQPVTFRYKKALDPEALPQFGLVAEQVAKVDPDLVMRDADGKPYTVRYEEVNAMLLNEFLKEHRTVQELKSTVAKQEATIAQQQEDSQITAAQQEKEIKALTASLKEQASQIAKVSGQIEANKPSPQMVAENQ